ncbi:hypothetical protein NMY22_g15188 [Coprinellus aureogranulatus]|nr:hypothetical protein NMY22_g15188 [Coprinellus aureogranulatus]
MCDSNPGDEAHAVYITPCACGTANSIATRYYKASQRDIHAVASCRRLEYPPTLTEERKLQSQLLSVLPLPSPCSYPSALVFHSLRRLTGSSYKDRNAYLSLETPPGTNPEQFCDDSWRGGDIVRVIGPTGSGKSSLINEIVGGEVAVVGHGLSTCTQELKAYSYTLPPDFPNHAGQTVLLVDTPGFDDTSMHESTRVFKAMAQWLTENSKAKSKTRDGRLSGKPQVAGFVYLQDITQKRVNNRQNIDFLRLQKLSDAGGDSYSKLILTTYQWPKDKNTDRYRQCLEREKELETNFWKDLVGKGARTVRVEGPGHARNVVVEALGNPHLTFP